jgi:hypothetical protein
VMPGQTRSRNSLWVMTSPARSTSVMRRSNARPPTGRDSSPFFSNLSATNSLKGPKTKTSFVCESNTMTVCRANMPIGIAVKLADGPYCDWKLLGHDYCSGVWRQD